MSIIATFPFAFIGKSSLGKIYRPYAIIEVFSKLRQIWQPVEVVIDSGADYTLFPRQYASILGIDLMQDCKKEQTIGIGGTETVYQCKQLLVRIGNWRKHIPAGFLDRDDVPSLLGRLKCIEEIKLTFDKHKSILVR